MSTPRNRPCPLNEQAVGGALHALEPDEEMAMLLHVPQCGSCQAAVRAAEEVLSYLGESVEQVDPPPSLRDRIVTAAADTSQSPVTQPIPDVKAPYVPRHRIIERGAESRPLVDAALPRPRRSRLTRRRLVAASIALIGVLAVGGLAVRTTQLEQQSQTLAAQAQTITDLVGQLDRPGVQHAVLASDAGATTAAVVIDHGQRQVYTVGLGINGKGTSYVLWGIRAGSAPAGLGVFDVVTPDSGVHPLGTVAANEGFTAYAISIEPGHTVPAKPSTVVAQGQVATA